MKTYSKQKILFAQSDTALFTGIEAISREQSFEFTTATDGEEALRKAMAELPALIVLDMGLPKRNGLEVCRRIRGSQSNSHPAILALTSGVEEAEQALTQGADDFIHKPAGAADLMLRTRRLLRSRPSAAGGEGISEIAIEELHLDIPRHRATVNGEQVELTPTEFKLLRVLAQRRGWVQSREQLLQDVWQYSCAMTTRTIDVHMVRLRRKLGASRRLLQAVRGVGYRFVEN